MCSKFNVLCVEDETFANEALTFILKANKYVKNVDSAFDGLEALEKIKNNNNYDLIITDLKMPNMDGMELIKNAKELDENINAIILTAFDEKQFIKEAMDNEINSFLTKPLDFKKLNLAIETLYDKKDEKDKKELEKEQSHRQNAIDDTLDNIAHHWRQPLSVISIEAQSILVARDMGTLIENDLENGLKLIVDITKKLSESIEKFHLTNVTYNNKINNLRYFIKGILKDFDEIIEINHVKINIDVDDNLEFLFDSMQLGSCVKDILLNSLEQFNIKKIKNPSIKIKAYKENESLVLEIQDNALGIEEDDLPKIFEPYFTTKFKSLEKGLGLYFAKNLICNTLKGELTVKNKYDGVINTIKIPKAL